MPIAATARIQRVRHTLKMRDVVVARIEQLTPHFRSITFRGEDLADFVSVGFDDHVKVILPAADGSEPARRDYTPRRYDPAMRELTLEFALHGDGPACEWAERARVGQHLLIGGPKGSMVVPVDYDWHLFIGDETALPAVARRLEELPATTQAIVLLQTADPADRRRFESAATVEQRWVTGNETLLDAVRALRLPEGEGYAWCAGEAMLARAVRKLLVDDKGHDRHAIRAAAYWKAGVVGHHENLGD